MKKIINITICALAFVFLTSTSFSIDMPKVPGIGKKDGGGGGDIDIESLAKSQGQLVGQMSAALSNLAQAQSKFLEAFGLKKEADALLKTTELLKDGETTPKKNLEKASKNVVDSQVLIDEKIKQGKIDAEGKIKFAEGLPPYGKGSINMVGAGMESIELFKSLKGTKDLTVIRKLGSLIYLGKNAPKLISTFSKATSTISEFNSKNEIPEPKEFKDSVASMDDV